jgi:hypothetical protein
MAMPVFEQTPTTAMRFGRAPRAWPFLGHAAGRATFISMPPTAFQAG